MNGVSILGAVSESEKDWLLRACDIFVLPSRGEGQSPAILEAMSYGKPTLFTTTCFFVEAVSSGAGVECAPSADGVAEGLRRFAAMTTDEADSMGQRARTMISQRHDVRDIASALDAHARLEVATARRSSR